MSDSDIAQFDGHRGAAARRPAAASHAASPDAVALASGERLDRVVALSVDPAPSGGTRCALYVLRVAADGFEEGRANVSCPASGLAGVTIDHVPLRALSPGRTAALRAALSGAHADRAPTSEPTSGPGAGAADVPPAPASGGPSSGSVASAAAATASPVASDAGAQTPSAAPGGSSAPTDRIFVRVVTDRRTVEGPVPAPRWPDPGATGPEPCAHRAPASLAELWEAVMYPRRYRVPAPAAATHR